VPAALEGRVLFESDDPVAAGRLLSQLFGEIEIVPASTDFSAAVNGAKFRDVSMLYVDLGVAAELSLRGTGGFTSVHMPMNGRALVDCDGETVEATTIRAAVTAPGSKVRMAWEHDSPQLVIRIDHAALERHLARLLGQTLNPPLRFDLGFDHTTDAATRWHGAVQLLHTEVFYSGSLTHQGVGIGPLEELVMSTLLYLQPSNYSDQLRLVASKPGKRVVRRAIEHLDQRLAEQISVTDLARHIGVSVRSLQQGFKEELGTTPMNYLRDRRLDEVRAELLDAMPIDARSVSEVAMKWGFNHLGNFAAAYRKRFGESPSDTLRR
jgi:AraC-like DNA-binding protein